MPETYPVPGGKTKGVLFQAGWAIAAAFGAYFCMYGFRKPYTAASFREENLWGLDWKSVLVIAQVLGYTLSKFLGIKVISELPARHRALGIVGLIFLAELSLAGFAVTPAPWSAIFLFLNGIPLGMVFGLVLGFLEGRRMTEILAAGLCASFILADGVMKTVGTWLLENGVTEKWMPAFSGLVFLPPLCATVWMLSKIQPPDHLDVVARTERTTLDGAARRDLFRKHAPGLICITLGYLLLTILRSVRADFAPEIWLGLTGDKAVPSVFTTTEFWVAAGVMLVFGATVLIRDNRFAFFTSLGLCLCGLALCLGAAAGFWAGAVGPFAFVAMVGLGLYLPYAAVHISVFERLLAMSRDRGTSSYLLYLADSFGYLGYVVVLVLKNLTGKSLATDPATIRLVFLNMVAWIGLLGMVLFACAWAFFARRLSRERADESSTSDHGQGATV